LLGKVETRVGAFIVAAISLFVYMGFQIGAFRFNTKSYHSYTTYFNDSSGLSRKAEVRIAGVKVGWVEEINLFSHGRPCAQVKVCIEKRYCLYENAYAIIRQDGFLGSRYIEMVPGDPTSLPLADGSQLKKLSTEQVSMDELFHKLKHIADNIEIVADSLQKTVGGAHGQAQLHSIITNVDQAAYNIASFSSTLEHAVTTHKDALASFFHIGDSIHRVTEHLEMELLPTISKRVNVMSDTFTHELHRASSTLESTAQRLQEASYEICNGFKSIQSVAQKIDGGQGMLGKLVNEDETYRDVKIAAEGLRNYFAKIESFHVVLDTYFESMLRPAENYNYPDSKGYFNVRLYTTFDYFLMVQLVSSEKGFVDRYEVNPSYRLNDGCPVDPNALDLSDQAKIENVFTREVAIFNRGAVRFGAQIGKMFGPLTFRLGIFENTAGAAVDFDIPLGDERLRWITTFEAFDFNGWNRKDDRSPHFKWLNRIFLLNSVYATFGADDFVSKRNASVFVGAGLRFGDDDMKYILSSVAGGLTGVAYYDSNVSITV
jgi:phospholipid/cholesterol/gamma-HCH transport system substrate-binding protein